MDAEDWLRDEAPFHDSEEIAYCPDPPLKRSPRLRKPPPYLSRREKRKRSPSEAAGRWQMDQKIRAWLVKEALNRTGDNLAKRHELVKSAAALSKHFLEFVNSKEEDRDTQPFCLDTIEDESIPYKRLMCYGCNTLISKTHSNYIFSCEKCGNIFEYQRYSQRPLPETWAVVTGGRTKLGYQIVLKLLRAGAHCIPTTRQPERAMAQYAEEPDSDTWIQRLHMYPSRMDFLSDDLPGELSRLHEFIHSQTDHIDILINCAAQTIRAFNSDRPLIPGQTNKYGDPAKLMNAESSWNLSLEQVSFSEWKEVFAVNTIAPAMLLAKFIPMLRGDLCASDISAIPKFAYVLNVHAREGIFNVRKSTRHIHTNMAKAGLAMLTKCMASRQAFKRKKDRPQRMIRMHGVDPGWISTDEYSEDACPWIIPPLDEVDGAARILQPLWEEMKPEPRTRRHFTTLTY